MASTPGIAHLIDEASFQHDLPINYAAVVQALALEFTGGADPATFPTPVYVGVIVKLTEGTDYVNPYAIQDAEGFAAVRLTNVIVNVWYYHFVHSLPAADAQIAWAIQNCTYGVPRIWMDVEQGGIDPGQGWTDLVNTATAMLEAPCAVGLYTNLTGLSHFPNRAAGVANLWLADPSDASPGTRRSITQVGQGTIPGIAGPVDLDTAEVSVLKLIPCAASSANDAVVVTSTVTPAASTPDTSATPASETTSATTTAAAPPSETQSTATTTAVASSDTTATPTTASTPPADVATTTPASAAPTSESTTPAASTQEPHPATTQPAAEPSKTGSAVATVAAEEPKPTLAPQATHPATEADPMSQLREFSLQVPMIHAQQVRIIQTLLRDLYGLMLAVDGWYGPITRGAVESFQSTQHIAVDGIVGPITWGRLLDA